MLQLLFAAGIDQLHPVGSADQLVARAEAILARRRDRPLLLWVHFFDCHLPYRHADATDLPAARMRTLERSARAEILRDPHWATSAGTEQLRRAYRNEVEHVDRAILGLLEQLETRPRDRVVLLLSDHGEELFERGSVGHGHSVHEEIVGLALALARLGGADGPARQVTTPVGHLDVAPTLLKLGGLPIASLPGQDLLGSVEARPYHSRNLYWPGEDPERRAIRAGRWKALVGRGGDRALYDLERDPGERRRLVREPVEAARALRRPAPLGRRDPRPPAAELDARDRDALRALGYLDE